MRAGLRARQLVNLVNGSTLAGLGVAALGGARVARSADGLFLGTGYRLPVPPAPGVLPGQRDRHPAGRAYPSGSSGTRRGTPPSTPGAAGW